MEGGPRPRRGGRAPRERDREAGSETDRHRAFVRRADRATSSVRRRRVGRDCDRSCARERCVVSPALGVARRVANRHRAVSLTKAQFRYGFGNALSAQESDELWERWAIPSPGKPLFEAALANLAPRSPAAVDRKSATRGPLLITAGGKDHTVPATVSRQTQKLYRGSSAVTDLRSFPDRGHSLTIDSGWREVADSVLGWLREHGL